MQGEGQGGNSAPCSSPGSGKETHINTSRSFQDPPCPDPVSWGKPNSSSFLNSYGAAQPSPPGSSKKAHRSTEAEEISR
ncbi:hypothetical protein Y1Q_0007625 [Alligator mississippiensis]|uniref:Uncharacterized protein n=1 Tax=Alligator mississippiensis TaxID=8496 RepID=A0A151NC23_ALLMI|nr:hypothetical protein Y1Q_0007625 [Alligator mississippiensis]